VNRGTQGPEADAIRALLEDWAAAVRTRDLGGILAHHSTGIVMFDVPPPPVIRGIEAYARTWRLFFAAQAVPVVFDIIDLEITAGSDVAFAVARMRCVGSEAGELEFRLTVGLRKIRGAWTVVHEHHSLPAN